MNYGIPYMGSKSKIAGKICCLFPRATHFYDLFGGGFSITHFMLAHRSKHYQQFHFNEIRPGISTLIKDAIAGKYSCEVYKPRWVSRQDFLERADVDPLIKILWSFGNNGKDYLFGEDIEEYKRSMHMAVVFNEFDETAKSVFGTAKFKDGYSIKDRRLYLRSRAPTGLEQLERLERLEQLERFQQLEQLHFYSTSYENVPIKKGSIIYCDIPYQGTAKYDGNLKFNHKSFFDWAANQSEPVFISEYNVNDNRFKCVATISKRSLLSSAGNSTIKTEKVYVNNAGYLAMKSRAPRI